MQIDEFKLILVFNKLAFIVQVSPSSSLSNPWLVCVPSLHDHRSFSADWWSRLDRRRLHLAARGSHGQNRSTVHFPGLCPFLSVGLFLPLGRGGHLLSAERTDQNPSPGPYEILEDRWVLRLCLWYNSLFRK